MLSIEYKCVIISLYSERVQKKFKREVIKIKKWLAIVLALLMLLGLAGCGNDTAEENEVMSYLTKYSWYYEIGGNYNMMEMYQFQNDNTYVGGTFSDISEDFYEGSFEINTNKDTIQFKPSDGKGYTWTYSLDGGTLKVFSDTKEFSKLEN